jgi:heme/copper-type cytochrome/quinol oxidase subunit 2
VLELTWTIIPAIVLTYLVINGWVVWSKTMDEPAKLIQSEKVEFEIVGQQFAWSVRYPGSDKKLGNHFFKNIDADNSFGLKVTDEAAWDDYLPREIVLPKGKNVHMVIRAKDVLHSVYLPHFRVKMDAMPGSPTEFWFVPTKTTQEMRNELDNQEFDYEVACTEMCGKGHYSMRYIVKVLEVEDYNKWLKESSKSSWALENGKYVLTQLNAQGAPTKTVASFINFMMKLDATKGQEQLNAYLADIGEKDKNATARFMSEISSADPNLGSSIHAMQQAKHLSTTTSDSIVTDTSSIDKFESDDKSKNLLQKVGDKIEDHREAKAEKNGDTYIPKENKVQALGNKIEAKK